MRILDKYLLKEILGSSLSVLVIFMVILSSNTMLRLIEEASVGSFPTYLLFPIIFVKITQYSIYIIPISLFFGIIISLGRFYNNNEMAVISSSGLSPIELGKILGRLIIPTSVLVAIFSLYITPSVTEYRYKLEHRLNSEEKIEEIRPGRFISSQNGRATFFVEDIKNGNLNDIFFSTYADTGATAESSSSASYVREDNRRYIVLKEGTIVELLYPYESNVRTTQYKEHGIQLGQDLPEYVNKKYEAMSGLELLVADNLESYAELQTRLLLPIATLVLGFLAIPLSYSSPRKGRYNKVFLGALIYFTYFISMSIVKKMYLLEFTYPFFGLWWLHVIAISTVFLIYMGDNKKIPERQ